MADPSTIVIGNSVLVIGDSGKQLSITGEVGKKPHSLSRGMNPVSLIGMPLKNGYTGSEASLLKPLSRSGAVLAQLEPWYPIAELTTWDARL